MKTCKGSRTSRSYIHNESSYDFYSLSSSDYDDSATKTILKAGKASSESSEEAAIVRKVLKAFQKGA